MGKIVGGWDKPQVALAQHDLVIKELSVDSMTIGPYAAFRWAMNAIGRDFNGFMDIDMSLETGSLLDVGCGVGHYGVLCERFYPGIHYTGTDVSPSMIAYARGLAPLGTFNACDFKDNDFADFDIILAGQIIEQLDDPPAMLDWLLTQARQYIILNRIRLTAETSHRITEGTYCGEMGRTWLWNREDITQRIEKNAQIVAVNDWWATDQVTFVVNTHIKDDALILQEAKKSAKDFISLDELLRQENDESAELRGCQCGPDKDCTC